MNKQFNHYYYQDIIDLCDFLKYYNIDNKYINNVIKLLIKTANYILNDNLEYIDKLNEYYMNLQKIKDKCCIILRTLILTNQKINNELINKNIQNIYIYLDKINKLIDNIYKEYYQFNIKNNKLIQILYDINNLINKQDINSKIFLRYNSFLNLLYIPDKILINMLRKITYKYNKILLLYNQTIELFINDQQELIKNNIITKIIFPSDFLNFDFNSFQFI